MGAILAEYPITVIGTTVAIIGTILYWVVYFAVKHGVRAAHEGKHPKG